MRLRSAAAYLAAALVCAAIAAALFHSAPAREAPAEPELYAALHVFGYGYKVRVLINGGDTGARGGLSEGRRLFGKADRAAAGARPELLAEHFVLLRGANEVTIEYSKIDPGSEYPLEIVLDAEGYPEPVLRFMSRTKASDKVVTSVMIETKPPESFTPVILGDVHSR